MRIMIIFIPKKVALQVMADNRKQSPNFRLPVESYKHLCGSMTYIYRVIHVTLNSDTENIVVNIIGLQ